MKVLVGIAHTGLKTMGSSTGYYPRGSSMGSLLSALLRTAVLPAGFAGALVAPGLLVVVVTWSHLSKRRKGDSKGSTISNNTQQTLHGSGKSQPEYSTPVLVLKAPLMPLKNHLEDDKEM